MTQLELVVSKLLQQNADKFFELMYRLDISEKKLNEALANNEDAVSKLAELVYERQQQKVISRKQFPKKDVDDINLQW